jgi:hypothetical protein
LHRLKRFLGLFQQKTAEKPCKFQNNVLSLQRQSVMIGYPGRIPRGQDYTATAHFESRFLAAFYL